MRHDTHSATPAPETVTVQDLRLPNGCILCGGDLDVRVSDGVARSVCRECRWFSRPHMQRHEDGIHVVHPAGGMA
jgi:hypothetical protein